MWPLALPTPLLASGPPAVQWTQIIGQGGGIDDGRSVQQTADGGYIIVGQTNYQVVGTAVWLIKTDASGIKVWSKTFDGPNLDAGYSVQQTTDGGYIIAGLTWSTTFGNTGPYVYLIKADASGNMVWQKAFGSFAEGYSVQQTTDGGYIIAGNTQSSGAGSYDVYLIKADASGNMVWSKTFGGANADFGYSVNQTADGGYIIAGTTSSFGAGNYDVYLVKTDASGNLTWSQTFGGANYDVASSVRQTADGGYIIGGTTSSFGAGGYDVYLIKTNASGNLTWSQTFGGVNADAGASVQPTTGGGYIIAGTTQSSSSPGSSDVYLVKTNASGNLTWSKTVDNLYYDGSYHSLPDYGYSVQQTADGGYIIAGSTPPFTNQNPDVYLIKVAADQQAPTVTTDNATNITSNSAMLYGTMTSLGTATSANVSFDWGLSSGNYTGT
ncbi:MAG: hypothetical protein HW402_1166, partial [Dehalococcoidales bacterium]|nr:hypothetical protein [Dehalococcoidales bacterium]